MTPDSAAVASIGRDVVELRKLAEAVATIAPGEWEAVETRVHCDDVTGQRVCDTKGEFLFWTTDQKHQLAAYIANASPDVILAFIARIETLEAALSALVKCHDDFLASTGNMEEAYCKLAKYAHPQWQQARSTLARTTQEATNPDAGDRQGDEG